MEGFTMEKPMKPCVQIIFHTKEGYEYSRRLDFDTDEDFERWKFEKYVANVIMHERGMFAADQAAFISIDTIARIEYESYDGVPF